MTAPDKRHTQALVDAWHRDGFSIAPNFLTADEVQAVLDDFTLLYADRGKGEGVGQAVNKKLDGALGATHPKQFMNIDSLPYPASPAINLISLHPAIINYAKALLGVADVHLYQSHTWAKYTGEADYDQPFHCDFVNHTLTVPADNAAERTVDFIVYLTDVTNGEGALHYVTKPDTVALLGPGAVFVPDELQHDLRKFERSAAGPAGTLVAHGIDTFHRGTNLTTPNGYRYTMTLGYKAAGNDNIGFHTWQTGANKPWDIVLDNASPEQLSCLGIPKPGDAFWTERTLNLCNNRWPNWDMQAYFDAARLPAS